MMRVETAIAEIWVRMLVPLGKISCDGSAYVFLPLPRPLKNSKMKRKIDKKNLHNF